MKLTGPSKKRYKERIIRITKELKEECITEEWIRLKRVASYAQHRGHCSTFLRLGDDCNCGLDDALLTEQVT